MPSLSLIVIVLVVLALCVLGLSIGLIMGRKGVRSCGRAAGEDGDSLTCPSCENRGGCTSRKLAGR